ncbi:MAG: FAD-binding oxidoreductase, partial [Wenzhouxiangella sp.]
VEAVEAELHRLGKVHDVPGRPYLSYRISQSYQTGVCIYFTLGFCGRGLEQADTVYQAIEQRLREVVLDHGGSLSHHHGIGKVRQHFVRRVHSETAIRAIRGIKQSIDPGNIFASGNHVFGRQFGDQATISADYTEKASLADRAGVAD